MYAQMSTEEDLSLQKHTKNGTLVRDDKYPIYQGLVVVSHHNKQTNVYGHG